MTTNLLSAIISAISQNPFQFGLLWKSAQKMWGSWPFHIDFSTIILKTDMETVK